MFLNLLKKFNKIYRQEHRTCILKSVGVLFLDSGVLFVQTCPIFPKLIQPSLTGVCTAPNNSEVPLDIPKHYSQDFCVCVFPYSVFMSGPFAEGRSHVICFTVLSTGRTTQFLKRWKWGNVCNVCKNQFFCQHQLNRLHVSKFALWFQVSATTLMTSVITVYQKTPRNI